MLAHSNQGLTGIRSDLHLVHELANERQAPTALRRAPVDAGGAVARRLFGIETVSLIFDLDDQAALTSRIELAALAFIDDVEGYLSERQPV